MNRQAQTVYLKATPEVLFRHLLPGRQKRPLLAGKTDEEMRAYIAESLARRAPFYERANYIFDVNLLETRQQIQASLEQLRTMLNL